MADPRPQVSRDSIDKALAALLKWISSRSTSNQRSDDLAIYLILTLKKIPHSGRSLSFSLPLPHPLHNPTPLILDDRTNSPFSPSSLQKPIETLSLPLSIVPISHLQSLPQLPFAYSLVDKRIARLLPKVKKKGSQFVKLDLKRKSWPEEARRAVRSTELKFRGGTCCGITVGRAGMARKEITENVGAAVEAAVSHVPKKWANVRALHLKAAESVALPIYRDKDGEEE